MQPIKKTVADAPSQTEGRGTKVRAMLRAQLGEDIYSSWFNAMEFDSFDGRVVKVSVPVKFLRTWIQAHYSDQLLGACKAEFKTAERVEVVWRQPGTAVTRATDGARQIEGHETAPAMTSTGAAETMPKIAPLIRPAIPATVRTSAGGLEGSPLDPRYTFDSFVIGAANRMSHAGATQVAETVLSDQPGFNPLYIHSSVGLGKTHLLHAIAWEVKRRAPQAQVLYLTAERFSYQFVEA
ncbi:MAG: DnaA/Hda family protein, partial [Hyphomicrobium sp.]